MHNTNRTMWLALMVVAGIALASTSYADTVYKSGRSKGMALLTVTADSGEDIWEVNLSGLGDTARSYCTPPGWFGELDGPYMRWWTDDYNCRIAAGASLSGFGIKVTGKGWAAWETRNGDGDFIDQGLIRLKGRIIR